MLLILDTAYENGSFRFLRQSALNWLTNYPGDLGVNLLLAKGLFAEGKRQQALPILEKLLRLDPEFTEALALMAQAAGSENPDQAYRVMAELQVVGDGQPADTGMPAWVRALRGARLALAENRVDESEMMARQVMGSEPDNILAAILYLQSTSARNDPLTTAHLAKVYHTRWPECLHFSLYLAEAMLETGDEAGAVALLHKCVVNDAAAQVPTRMWGDHFPYRPLWPDPLEISFDLPIPAEVSGQLGWNLLQSSNAAPEEDEPFLIVTRFQDPEEEMYLGRRAEMPGQISSPDEEPEDGAVYPFIKSLLEQAEQTEPDTTGLEGGTRVEKPLIEESIPTAYAPAETEALVEKPAAAPVTFDSPQVMQEEMARRVKKPLDETTISIQNEFEQIASRIKQPGIGRGDGRFPVYVILSTRSGLLNQYGANTADVVQKDMLQLAELIRKRKGWGALVFTPDDAVQMEKLGLEPVTVNDPWKLKLSLADLDGVLAKKGEMIGALLIVGGAEVVPFHHLPNPTDDMDVEILSDNPYATLDSNYFVQDWQIGRFPGEAGTDAGVLLEQLRQAIRYHSKGINQTAAQRSRADFWRRVQIFLSGRKSQDQNLGYTAAVWRRSSLAVFRPIGEAQAMLASPPQASGLLKTGKTRPTLLAYYNLHGLPDAAEWYGQRDTTDPTPAPDYPVALSPRDINGKTSIPEIVFSEACYGALINGKKEDQSMALKFLAKGTLALIGSTGAAYGSVSVPLIGADLLGHYFWKGLKEGRTTGDALMQAKLDLVREMNRRQGYLDGEDQKTLISFVLYGDPLVTADLQSMQSKTVIRPRGYPVVKTICDKDGCEPPAQVSPEVVKRVKQIVAEYLPGIDRAEMKFHSVHASCSGSDHHCPTSQIGVKSAQPDPKNMVVTVCQKVRIGKYTHHQYARVTLDSKGKMVKLALSR